MPAESHKWLGLCGDGGRNPIIGRVIEIQPHSHMQLQVVLFLFPFLCGLAWRVRLSDRGWEVTGDRAIRQGVDGGLKPSSSTRGSHGTNALSGRLIRK